jgi:hypothetical protein
MKKVQLVALLAGGLGLVAGLAGMLDGQKAFSLAAGLCPIGRLGCRGPRCTAGDAVR